MMESMREGELIKMESMRGRVEHDGEHERERELSKIWRGFTRGKELLINIGDKSPENWKNFNIAFLERKSGGKKDKKTGGLKTI